MRLIGEAGLDGWLVADFRRNNPILLHLLGLESGVLSRRCFLWLPAEGKGEPVVMGSRVDGHTFSGRPHPVILYEGFADMCASLLDLIPRGGQVAMEYVEDGRLPTVSRVDAGLIDFIRGAGITVVSSATLIAALEVWDARQRELHEHAARVVDEARRLAVQHCFEAIRRGEIVTERTLTDLIANIFTQNDMLGNPPDVAVGAHAADPHYALREGEDGAAVTRDSVLLIDLFTRVSDEDGAPYADSTWMAYTGSNPPEQLVRIFEAVRKARDRAIGAIDEAVQSGQEITGQAVDRLARESIQLAGFGDYLVHRTGHSLGSDHVHGLGTNLDDIEFPDDRPLLTWSGFTVEPGLYLPGELGMRLEVSAILTPRGVSITTERQEELTLLREG
jgi:Xaa-Pro aminopeptidase